MIATEAAHPNCMYMWMNHMASAEANAQATSGSAKRRPAKPPARPPRTISPGHCDAFHATDEAYFENVWYWSTPQADCADADDATECVDWDGWVEAWTGIVGG